MNALEAYLAGSDAALDKAAAAQTLITKLGAARPFHASLTAQRAAGRSTTSKIIDDVIARAEASKGPGRLTRARIAADKKNKPSPPPVGLNDRKSGIVSAEGVAVGLPRSRRSVLDEQLSSIANTPTVKLPDPNLPALIRDAKGKPPAGPSRVEMVKEYLKNKGRHGGKIVGRQRDQIKAGFEGGILAGLSRALGGRKPKGMEKLEEMSAAQLSDLSPNAAATLKKLQDKHNHAVSGARKGVGAAALTALLLGGGARAAVKSRRGAPAITPSALKRLGGAIRRNPGKSTAAAAAALGLPLAVMSRGQQ